MDAVLSPASLKIASRSCHTEGQKTPQPVLLHSQMVFLTPFLHIQHDPPHRMNT